MLSRPCDWSTRVTVTRHAAQSRSNGTPELVESARERHRYERLGKRPLSLDLHCDRLQISLRLRRVGVASLERWLKKAPQPGCSNCSAASS